MNLNISTDSKISRRRRLAFAFGGLLASNALLLLFLLQDAIRVRSSLVQLNIGPPERQIPQAITTFVIYGSLSFLGWLLIGLPVVLFVPERSILRLPWPLRIAVGLLLGPVALFAIVAVLSRGQFQIPGSFESTGLFWLLSAVLSAVAFSIYTALLRKEVNDKTSGRSFPR